MTTEVEGPATCLTIEFESGEQLQKEYDSRLRKGVVVAITSEELSIGDLCEVALLFPATGDLFQLKARVTSTRLPRRAVCQIEDFTPQLNDLLWGFVGACAHIQPSPSLEIQASDEVWTDDEPLEEEAGDDPNLLRTKIPAHVHERLRHLPLHEVLRVARSGHLTERIAVERIYGKTVWEPLLQNPNLTAPEVARIGRMGSLPKPLIETIISHPAWLSSSVVRRALLSNPRLGGNSLVKVLRATPKVELKMIQQQSAYPMAVREAAKRLSGPA